ncbi:MAG: AAA family ATPase, partial [Candidatus Omnitrophica bacterium]|nr:AAA family ATPase [Candidatus Omnitrophota bacterium]
MYLKKLELNGFKSFAQPVKLEFSPGVTAIVGPNGSGKSNVADAVRWILGEQSMKNIRSQSSKDLIFSGSKTRSRLGKANVVLCFDNQSGCIPLDFSEVIVSRNIFRDGTSEYFVNKNPSKLMDVVEILAKANIGHRGFSVI